MLYYHFLKSKDAIDDLGKKRIKISTLDSLNDPFELMPYLAFKEKGPYHKVRKKIGKKWGLLCFSKNWRESLLWGHYADKHHGMALGFEVDKNIRKVEYVLERKKIKLGDTCKENEKLFLDKLAYEKYNKWEYEEEYRMWVELKNCDEEEGKYYISFNDNLKIKEIILGSRFDYEGRADEIKKLAKINGVSAITATRLEWSWFRINPCGTKKRKFFPE